MGSMIHFPSLTLLDLCKILKVWRTKSNFHSANFHIFWQDDGCATFFILHAYRLSKERFISIFFPFVDSAFWRNIWALTFFPTWMKVCQSWRKRSESTKQTLFVFSQPNRWRNNTETENIFFIIVLLSNIMSAIYDIMLVLLRLSAKNVTIFVTLFGLGTETHLSQDIDIA